MNEEILEEICKKNYSDITEKIQNFLQKQLSESNAKGFVLGLSGGIDSAVVAYLCYQKFKEKTLVLIMPDTKISPKSETEDALKIVDKLGLEYKLIDIGLIVSEYEKYIEPNEKAVGNLRARIRANLLYYYANVRNYLVVGTSDKSEFLIGYFTKFGDGSADILPIVGLYKTQVRGIAKFLGVPDSIIEKKSSPHLWKEHVAEEELGVRYEEVDSILHCLESKKLSPLEIAKKIDVKEDVVAKIYQMYKNSQHKRITAPQAEIS